MLWSSVVGRITPHPTPHTHTRCLHHDLQNLWICWIYYLPWQKDFADANKLRIFGWECLTPTPTAKEYTAIRFRPWPWISANSTHERAGPQQGLPHFRPTVYKYRDSHNPPWAWSFARTTHWTQKPPTITVGLLNLFWTSDIQNCQIIKLCYFKPLRLW